MTVPNYPPGSLLARMVTASQDGTLPAAVSRALREWLESQRAFGVWFYRVPKHSSDAIRADQVYYDATCAFDEVERAWLAYEASAYSAGEGPLLASMANSIFVNRRQLYEWPAG